MGCDQKGDEYCLNQVGLKQEEEEEKLGHLWRFHLVSSQTNTKDWGLR